MGEMLRCCLSTMVSDGLRKDSGHGYPTQKMRLREQDVALAGHPSSTTIGRQGKHSQQQYV